MKKLLILSLLFICSCSVDTEYMTEPRPDYEWLYPDNTIYFYFYDYGAGNGLPEYSKEAVREAADIITDNTNANIIEVAGKEDLPEGIENYVVIYENAFSIGTKTGMQQGINKMYISYVDSPETPLHEFGHELGLPHEQVMAYRDNDIVIHWDNMYQTDRTMKQFLKSEYSFNKTAIDFESIMIYDSYAGSKNEKPTMTKKDGSTWEGNYTLSKGDIKTINYLYPIEHQY